MSCVYLLHLNRPFHHARHYIGMSYDDNPLPRLERHRRGTSRVRFLRAAQAAGISFELVRVWSGAGRAFERKLKTTRGDWSTVAMCPRCSGESAFGIAVYSGRRDTGKRDGEAGGQGRVSQSGGVRRHLSSRRLFDLPLHLRGAVQPTPEGADPD